MPDATSTDPVAAYLDAARQRFSNTNYAITMDSPRLTSVLVASTSDVPRLLAAVEVVLERHQPRMETIRTLCPAHRYVRLNPVGRDLVDKCPACSTAREPVCVTCPCGNDAWPCAEALAISEALTGKEGTDA